MVSLDTSFGCIFLAVALAHNGTIKICFSTWAWEKVSFAIAFDELAGAFWHFGNVVRLEFGNLPDCVYRSVTAVKICRGG